MKQVDLFSKDDMIPISPTTRKLVDTHSTFYQGDCLVEMDKIADKSVDMILCDLPYGTTKCKWDILIPFYQLWKQYNRIAKNNAAIILTASQPFTSTLVLSNLPMFKYELIWNKMQGKAPGVAKYRPMPAHESVLVFSNGKTTYNPQMKTGKPYKDIRTGDRAKINGNEHGFGLKANFSIVNNGERYPTSVLEIVSYNQTGQHPTQKPIELFEWIVKTYSNEGETVLDNCMGSGTTGVACKKTGRHFIGIEKDEKYFEIAVNRINSFLK